MVRPGQGLTQYRFSTPTRPHLGIMEGVLLRVDESIAQYIVAANSQCNTNLVIEVLDKNHLFVLTDAVAQVENLVKEMYDEMAERVMERKRVDAGK